MTRITWGLSTALTLLLTSAALACLHGPKDGGYRFDQEAQTALIFWAGGRQELFLSVDYEVTVRSPSPKSPPSGLAWVVPLPSAPDAYRVADAELLKSASEAWHRARPSPEVASTRSSGEKSLRADRGGIRLLEKVEVGDYEIQPIQTTDKASGAALNAWLTKNGFGEVPAANMAYYLERSWTWLAVKAKQGAADRSTVRTPTRKGAPQRGTLKPLQISFASEEIVYPLKFSSHQGTFSVAIYIATEKPLADFSLREGAYRSKSAPHGFRAEGYELELPDLLWEAHSAAKNFPGFPSRKVILTKISNGRVNNSTNPISEWTTDLAFKPHPTEAAKTAQPAASSAAGSSGGLCALHDPHPSRSHPSGGAWLLALVLAALWVRRP